MRLHEIEERCEKATKGPWRTGDEEARSYYEGDYAVLADAERPMVLCKLNSARDSIENASFIAHSREDLPECVRLLREAREIITSLGAFVPDILRISKVEKWLKEVEE